ncbi:MAG: hypothetical protein ACI8P3_000008 [Saprospiraceae bacterium]|jgi:hypothetical protein
MKNVFQLIGIGTILLAFLIPQISNAQIQVGDTHEGGIVFFIFGENKDHGLVCSKADLGSYDWTDAITACEAYKGEGFTDWYLPSEDELNMMYTNLHEKRIGAFTHSHYWNSLEDPYGIAWFQNFFNGKRENWDQGDLFLVRAVRVF